MQDVISRICRCGRSSLGVNWPESCDSINRFERYISVMIPTGIIIALKFLKQSFIMLMRLCMLVAVVGVVLVAVPVVVSLGLGGVAIGLGVLVIICLYTLSTRCYRRLVPFKEQSQKALNRMTRPTCTTRASASKRDAAPAAVEMKSPSARPSRPSARPATSLRLPSSAPADPNSPEAIEALRLAIEQEKLAEAGREQLYAQWSEQPDVAALSHDDSPPFTLLWPDDSPLTAKLADVFWDDAAKQTELFGRLDNFLTETEKTRSNNNNNSNNNNSNDNNDNGNNGGNSNSNSSSLDISSLTPAQQTLLTQLVQSFQQPAQ